MTEPLPGPPRTDAISVDCGGRRLTLLEVDGGLVVRNREGETLDPEAAHVLLSLGGSEPSWTRPIEGLVEAHRLVGFDADTLAAAADALDTVGPAGNQLARTSTQPAVIRALAAAGRAHVVQNPLLDVDDWRLLAHHRDDAVRGKVMDLVEVLPPRLAASSDPTAKALVAGNPACPPELLESLAEIDDDRIRVRVASNPAASGSVLRRLSRNRTPWVRAGVAANSSTPPRTAIGLIWDEAATVRMALTRRADLGAIALGWIERYARTDANYIQICHAISTNPGCSDRLRLRLDAIERNEQMVAAWRRDNPDARRLMPNISVRWVAGMFLLWVLLMAMVFAAVVLVVGTVEQQWLAVVLSCIALPATFWAARRLFRRVGGWSTTHRWRPSTPIDFLISAGCLIGLVAISFVIGFPVWVGAVVGGRSVLPRVRKKVKELRYR